MHFMKKRILFLFLFNSIKATAQKVFPVKFEGQADVKVFVVKY